MAYTESIQAFANNVQRQKFKRKAEQQWKNPNMCAACIPMIFVDRAHKDALAPQDESLPHLEGQSGQREVLQKGC
jgi:hypothetical protein